MMLKKTLPLIQTQTRGHAPPPSFPKEPRLGRGTDVVSTALGRLYRHKTRGGARGAVPPGISVG